MATRLSASNDSHVKTARNINGSPINGSTEAVWHKSAPEAVRRAFSSGDPSTGWAAWQRHLVQRRRPADPARLLPSKEGALSWALPVGLNTRPVPAWLDRAVRLATDRKTTDRKLETELLGWLGEMSGGVADVGSALEGLACCRALPALAAVLPSDTWWAVLDGLVGAAADAGQIGLESEPLAHQLLAGELALTLAYLLPEVAPCRKMKSAARRALSSGLVDLLDGEGLPHGRHLALLRPLLACWTRCCALGNQLEGGCWTRPADEQYQWLVHQALRLTRCDGTHVFSDGSGGDRSAELFESALRFGGDDEDRQIAALVLPRRKTRGKRSLHELDLPESATHSEWAAAAVLRPDWSRSGQRLTVLYPGQSLKLELACGKDILWSGPWELNVRLDGETLVPDSDWEQLCWVSDEDVDYLELQIDLAGDVCVQRQMLLGREDHFLLLADAVLGPRSGKLEYRGCLPLCPEISFSEADETREGFLVGSKRRASVLPLALPEWRCDRRLGELSQTGRGLELRQSTQGRRLYAPLWFDLDRRRTGRPLTWRQLTVAESLVIQPPEVAVGYRVTTGKDQWLIYRSLAEKANRTLLGHNLSTEMLVGRFDRSGEVEPLIEIE